jgi:DNA-binding XRE family transcriptional regulator
MSLIPTGYCPACEKPKYKCECFKKTWDNIMKNATKENDPNDIYIGKRIKQFRKEIGISQNDLADAICLNRTSVVNIEAGKQSLSIESLLRCCAILKTNPMDILPPLPKFKSEKVTEKKMVETERQKYTWT